MWGPCGWDKLVPAASPSVSPTHLHHGDSEAFLAAPPPPLNDAVAPAC
jgi:hypothetical protein